MDQITALYEHTLVCPLCQQTFTSQKLRSKFIKIHSYDTDFRPVYTSGSENGLLYHIVVCPKCGYAFSEQFSPFFAPGTKEAIQSRICNQWVPHDFGGKRSIEDAIQTYKLASLSGTLKKEKHIILAGIYMRIAWLYRMIDQHMQEARFLRMAMEEYNQSYSTGDFHDSSMTEVRILYMIGELLYRLGQADESIKYLSKVIESQNKSLDPKAVKMAKERWQTIREERNAK
ncbi:DUF2225 domain-containing protein [Bacillus sp. 1P06AnD]|uniref:DUF2225 domain-containing protein n=1 Tax=Bacillus sp. 1P06AnD TaxID=3132208 RepID=UPI0039A1F7EF